MQNFEFDIDCNFVHHVFDLSNTGRFFRLRYTVFMKGAIDTHKKSSEKSFGIVFSIVFLLISLYPILEYKQLQVWALIVSIVFFIISFLAPKILEPLNNIWFRFGIMLGSVISPIIMAVVFFIVILPIGLMMRIFRKDLLNRKINKQVNSYWIDRKPGNESMKDQF